jgi:hypothetical protein
MGADVGDVPAGYNRNFVYGTLALASNTYVRLVDLSDNAPGTNAEVLYANSLIVPAGCTLDLNGFLLYTRAAQIVGNIVSGSVTQMPDSGPITLGAATPGAISISGELDEWTFFGRAGRFITVEVDPGSGSATPPVLNWVQARVLDTPGTVLTTNSNSGSGQLLVLPDLILPADGTYRVQVRASVANTAATGSYTITIWDVTPDLSDLLLNQQVGGHIETPYSVDRWNFSAVAGTQVRFDLVNVSQPGIKFKLTGPSGWIGFSNLTSDSDLVNLPSSDGYTLTAYGTGGQYGGDYACRLVETVQTDLALGSNFVGQFVGSGQAQIFRISVPAANPMNVVLQNGGAGNANELYLKFNGPPSRGEFDYRFSGLAGPNQQITVPNAYAGTWYVLVYGDTTSTPGDYTLQATTAGMFVSSVTPDHHGGGADAVLTLGGAGFDSTTVVSLVASNGAAYSDNTLSVDSFTQLTVTIPSNSVPPGRYTVRASQPDGDESELTNAFEVEAGGEGRLVTRLIGPRGVGGGSPATYYVEYANTGNAAIRSPLLVVHGTKQPLLALNQELVMPDFWSFWIRLSQCTTNLLAGLGDSVQFLASGRTPGILQPGESVTVPIYYLGVGAHAESFEMSLSWLPTDSNQVIRPITGQPLSGPFRIEDFQVDWSTFKDFMRPVSIDPAAWEIIWANFTSNLGSSGKYLSENRW